MTSGSRGRSPCPTRAPAHTDCTGRFSAPSSRAESGGVTVWSCVGPDRDPGRALRRLVAGVEPGQQVAVGGQLPAAERALLGGDVAGQVGERRAVVRRAQGHDPAGDVGAAVGDPEPGDDAAGRVADDVDALRAGPVEGGVDRVGERVGRLGEVAGAVAGQLHDRGVAARGGQPVGERLQRRRRRRRSPGRAAPGRAAPGTPARPPGPPPATRGRRPAPPTARTTRAATAPSSSRRRAGERPASTPLLSLCDGRARRDRRGGRRRC